jgi:hypothetical protein
MQLEDVKNQIQAELDAKGLNMGYDPEFKGNGNGRGVAFITSHMGPDEWTATKQIIANCVAEHAIQGHWRWKLKPTFWGNGQPINGGFAFETNEVQAAVK